VRVRRAYACCQARRDAPRPRHATPCMYPASSPVQSRRAVGWAWMRRRTDGSAWIRLGRWIPVSRRDARGHPLASRYRHRVRVRTARVAASAQGQRRTTRQRDSYQTGLPAVLGWFASPRTAPRPMGADRQQKTTGDQPGGGQHCPVTRTPCRSTSRRTCVAGQQAAGSRRMHGVATHAHCT
jgi:hypothetical protein